MTEKTVVHAQWWLDRHLVRCGVQKKSGEYAQYELGKAAVQRIAFPQEWPLTYEQMARYVADWVGV
jgi:hypothetical protein